MVILVKLRIGVYLGLRLEDLLSSTRVGMKGFVYQI